MNWIFRYHQVAKNKGLVINPRKKLVVGCYADVDFAVLWVHENPQDPICDRSINIFVANFSNFPLLWVSKIQTNISLSTIHYEYVELSASVRDLLSLKVLIKEVIDNSGIDNEKTKFV